MTRHLKLALPNGYDPEGEQLRKITLHADCLQYDRVIITDDSYYLDVGLYQWGEGDYFAIAAMPGMTPAKQLPLTSMQFRYFRSMVGAAAEALALPIDQVAGLFRYQMPQLARELAGVPHLKTNPDPFELYPQDYPPLQRAIALNYTEDECYLMVRLALHWRHQRGIQNIDPLDKLGYLSVAILSPSSQGLYVHLFDARKSPLLNQVKALCHQYSAYGNPWDGHRNAWRVKAEIYPALAALGLWDLDAASQLLIKTQALAAHQEATTLDALVAPELPEKPLHCHPTIAQALARVAGDCDGAREEDGVGFNGVDARFGHQMHRLLLTDEPVPALDQLKLAELLPKYKSQHGLELPGRTQLIDFFDLHGIEFFQGSIALTDRGQGTYLQVRFPYDEAMKDAVKAICGEYQIQGVEKFDRITTTWNLAVHGLDSLLALPYRWQLDPELEQVRAGSTPIAQLNPLVPNQLKPPPPDWVIEHHGNGLVLVRYPYDRAIFEQFKAIAPYKKLVKYPDRHLLYEDKYLRQFHQALGEQFQFCDECLRLVAQQEQAAQELAAHGEAERQASYAQLAGDFDYDQVLPNGWTLMAHQKEAVRWVFRRLVEGVPLAPGKIKAMLALDMGLGKTLTSLVVAAHFRSHHPEVRAIFVVAPAFLRSVWREALEALEIEAEIYSYVKCPKPLKKGHYIVIADEAHYAANLKSQRTKKLMALMEHERCEMALQLTGTPLKNGRPREFYPLLKMLNHPLAEHRREYERYYCNAHATAFTRWDTSGSAHLDELHEEIQDAVLFMRKEDWLADLPEKTRILRPVEISADSKRIYRRTLQELEVDYRRRVQRKEISGEGEILVFLGHLRQAASVAKRAYAAAFAAEVAANYGKVVIFSEYVETVAHLAMALGEAETVTYTGSMTAEAKTDAIAAFQTGDARYFIASRKAAGVGLTLHAASVAILVDRPWTPGDAEQAEDRIHRIGQSNACQCYWLQYGVDSRVDEIIATKHEAISQILEGKRKRLPGKISVASEAKAILDAEFKANH